MRWTAYTTEPLDPDAAERVRTAFIASVRAGIPYDRAAKVALARAREGTGMLSHTDLLSTYAVVSVTTAGAIIHWR